MKKVMRAEIDPLIGIGGDGFSNMLQSMAALSSYVYSHTLYHLSEMQILQIMIGFVVGVDNACLLGIDRIEAMY